MPYIKQERRPTLDKAAIGALNAILVTSPLPFDAGDLNYLISKIVWELFDGDPSYANGSKLMAALECVKHEFYRRKLAPYEDLKIEENGDLA